MLDRNSMTFLGGWGNALKFLFLMWSFTRKLQVQSYSGSAKSLYGSWLGRRFETTLCSRSLPAQVILWFHGSMGNSLPLIVFAVMVMIHRLHLNSFYFWDILWPMQLCFLHWLSGFYMAQCIIKYTTKRSMQTGRASYLLPFRSKNKSREHQEVAFSHYTEVLHFVL